MSKRLPEPDAFPLTKCTACGSVEVELDKPDGRGTIDGEPCVTGYGCEVCS